MLPPEIADHFGRSGSIAPTTIRCQARPYQRRSGLRHFRRLRSLLPLDDFEFDLIALGERLESVALNRAEVHEDVRTALVRDETVALRIVEPLHGPLETSHCCLPLENCVSDFHAAAARGVDVRVGIRLCASHAC